MGTYLKKIPNDARGAVKFIMDTLNSVIYPLLSRISDKLHCQSNDEISDEQFIQIRNIYTLCADQIKKCLMTLVDIIKIEFHHGVYLQESRQFTIERMHWCLQKLVSIEQLLNKSPQELDSSNEIMSGTTMYFVNWIDQTLDILGKLSNMLSKNEFNKIEELSTNLKKELVDSVCDLHTSVDELLLSAMTLCKHCLPADQYVVQVRCQVVLRKTKSLLSELIEGDTDTAQATIETLKLPINPFHIKVRINVLKDVLYELETNTNTALLALVVHCFGQDVPPVEKLKKHFADCSSKTCSCIDTEECAVVNDFDLYNERLLQIGLFAISCSSDQKRILNLRSGLASLEALDPYLVPSMMLSPKSRHSSLLAAIWRQEMMLVRDNVFLIVDPAAFADKAKQMMRQILLEITKENSYDNNKTCLVINIACVICDLFDVYEKLEPDALICREHLTPLLKDLHKVQIECKIVSNLLSSTNEYKYDVKIKVSTVPTLKQLVKRLKLLYTVVKRINLLYNPKEIEDEEHLYDEPLDSIAPSLQMATYVKSPKKCTNNFSRSVFARSVNLRSSTGKFPLDVLTKHLKTRNNKDLSFSIKLDKIDMSELNLKHGSILYSQLKSKSSLRKSVLCKRTMLGLTYMCDQTDEVGDLEKESVVDEALSLQITDVLNQINDLTLNPSSTTHAFNTTVSVIKPQSKCDTTKNIMNLSENNDTSSFIGNITINRSVETTSNMTQPSEVNTLERINDLDLLESKLNDLKFGQIETSL